MNEKFKELKVTERELRRLVGNVFKTEVKDGTVYLQRLDNFIKSNNYIKSLLIDYDPTINFEGVLVFYRENKQGIEAIVPPEDETVHISCILGMLNFLCENQNLHEHFFWYKNQQNRNECIQSGLKDLLNPLYTLLSTKLVEIIGEIERNEKMPIQHFDGDYVARDKQHVEGDAFWGDNNKKTTMAFYKKDGYLSGVITGIISSLIAAAIIKLAQFLIGQT